MADIPDDSQNNMNIRGQSALLNNVNRLKGATSSKTLVSNASKGLDGTTQTAPVTPQGTDPDNLLSGLQNNSGWAENILNGLESGTYHARLFMADDVPYSLSSLGSYTELTDLIFKTKSQTTIAESGVTGLNIQDITLSTVPVPNRKTRSMNATSLEMNIIEPMGVSFMNTLADAAKELKISNFSKAQYYLAIRFMGYDETGEEVLNPCLDFPNKGTWLYSLQLISIDSTVNANGGSYRLTFGIFSDQVQDDANLRIPDAVHPSGFTVGSMLNDLANQLNASNVKMYGYPTKVYEFKFATLDMNGRIFKPEEFSILPTSPEKSDKRTYDLNIEKGNSIKGHFASGTTISDAVESIFANSETAQQLAKGVIAQDEIEVPDGTFRNCVIFRVHPTSEITSYDRITETYKMKYTFTIKPYFTQRPIITKTQIDVSQDPVVQASNALMLRKSGYLCKKFDFLFTGLNTEVINFDIKLNTAWTAMLPRVQGRNNSRESQTAYDLKNEQQELKNQQAELQQIANKQNAAVATQDDIDALKSTIAQNGGKATDDQTQKLKELNASLAKFTEGAAADVQTQTALMKNLSDHEAQINAGSAVNRLPASRPKVKYAEDLKDDPSLLGAYDPMQISLAQNPNDPRFMFNGALPEAYHRDRAILGAIMDQLYDDPAQGLQQIVIEVRGDPYWLGASNMEKDLGHFLNLEKPIILLKDPAANTLTAPAYDNGDVMFLLTFKYPRGIKDDGSPDIQSNDFFTGIYMVTKVTHKFSGGQFTQTLNACRIPLMAVASAFGVPNASAIAADKAKQDEYATSDRLAASRGGK